MLCSVITFFHYRTQRPCDGIGDGHRGKSNLLYAKHMVPSSDSRDSDSDSGRSSRNGGDSHHFYGSSPIPLNLFLAICDTYLA